MSTNRDNWSGRLAASVRDFTARTGSNDLLEAATAQLADAADRTRAGAGENESVQALIQAVGALSEINAVVLRRIDELERKMERPS